MEQGFIQESSRARLITSKNVILLVMGCFAIVGAFIFAILKSGIISLSLTDIFNAIFHHDPDSDMDKFIREIRLPIAINSLLYGAALATAGVLLQRVTRMTTACPSTLGLIPASIVAMVFASPLIDVFSQGNEWMYVLVYIGGAGCGLLLAYFFSLVLPIKPPGLRRLTGGLVAVGVTSLVLFFSSTLWELDVPLNMFQKGFNTNSVLIPIGLIGIFLSLGLSGRMNGSQQKSPVWLIGSCLVLAIVLTGTSAMTLGNWAMIGLVSSALARWLAGGDYRIVMPVAAIIGGVVVSVMNTLSTLIAPPFETPLYFVTALIGTPVLVILIWKEAIRYANRAKDDKLAPDARQPLEDQR
ncbi:iron chelate uptake ABC transporter family permease subunit [Cohnella mopanensis]|uniref:iron chelate uptake ABC transporter family permease subunit n=1 Tax=Cohnella mopanensis TaxID=2911966 RepID=UPI001EF8526A|nr:iron chelate uptake ABC transporter family permease subunit [Cohnella mopanensis]